ncbi:hypothetical protein [Halorubrum vacuolatum]|uniref:Uncharacterized protein n=1 Tax=Halorubrum vacuolatum TaxID=63740 RepID=A0A238UL47_HALVU|nr:hypothetical protein [Halorubrum vacuolatum]SNR22842.1 hypothetical protein SAMN06264855_10117 [Halorubrum vacuolatum]
MVQLPFTTDADRDAVPTIDRPTPDTDRGIPGRAEAPLTASVTLVVAVAMGAALGDPLTWSDAGTALTAVAAGLTLTSLLGRG